MRFRLKATSMPYFCENGDEEYLEQKYLKLIRNADPRYSIPAPEIDENGNVFLAINFGSQLMGLIDTIGEEIIVYKERSEYILEIYDDWRE